MWLPAILSIPTVTEGTLWPLDNLRLAGTKENGNAIAGEIRDTIVVWSYNPQQTADALPVLLPQLGIPVDAVGIVAFATRGPFMAWLLDHLPEGASAFRSVDGSPGVAETASNDGLSVWIAPSP